VVVLEATDRVGGRVWSEPLANGAIVERGAEFVLPGYETMRTLAARLGLAFREKGTLYGDREPRDGPPLSREELVAAVAQLGDARGASLAAAVDALPATEGARAAIASRLAISTAHELDDQPASILADGAAGFGAFPSHGIDGGNDLLARELAASLDVRLGRRIERVAWDELGVTVDDDNADVCVVATPADALVFDPPLPDWKRRAFGAVRYGHAAKVFLQLEHGVEPSATLSVPGRFWTWTEHGSRAVSSFAGTASALERLDVAHGPERWAAAVRLLRPDLPYADAEPVLATWPGGAYSARSLSSPLEDDALAEPVGPIAFAGEHTAREWHGLMEGALRSGLRAAAQCVT
jgi:monoamine oxidase